MTDDAARWKARAEGLADTLEEIWERGASVGRRAGSIAGYSSLDPKGPQLEAFNRRFRPWLFESEERQR